MPTIWIKRHLSQILSPTGLLEVVLVTGPRQVGKSSILEHYAPRSPELIELDDLSLRTSAQKDPALFFSQHPPPVIIDEFQYSPNILPEIKRIVGGARRSRRDQTSSVSDYSPLVYLSGSNQLEIDNESGESLAGRISIFRLHGLSVAESQQHLPDLSPWESIRRGGFPELYVRQDLSPISFLNDYISTFLEKDIARSGGVTKIDEFLLVTRLLAARAESILNRDGLVNDAGVASKTVGEWIEILTRAHLIYQLPVYSSNLNSRLTKAPKIYFIDTGLATRLQGHVSKDTILGSPQAGGLFENLVVAEVIKSKDHHLLPIDLSFWRTKDGEELDLILSSGEKHLLIEIKLAIQGEISFTIPRSISKEFQGRATCIVVTLGGKREALQQGITKVPLFELDSFIQEYFS